MVSLGATAEITSQCISNSLSSEIIWNCRDAVGMPWLSRDTIATVFIAPHLYTG
ncbi:MAG: hypothetical protein F6J93_26055 [Oscillatoria sp. SIO1A7]|nr:hypothetical protein [Oscillatoria sp. SIO1A7]